MLAIFKREVLSFFTTPVGYLIIGFFLVLNGLFLWVFKGDFNIFEYGFADLSKFFLLTPWVFLFLIPAVTMKSFSEEKKTGTLELLFIKPLSLGQTVYGKFFGALFLVVVALIPTFIYSICISQFVSNAHLCNICSADTRLTALSACGFIGVLSSIHSPPLSP